MIEFLHPPDDPINYEERDYELYGRTLHMVEVPLIMRRDWSIRTMIERALQYDDNTVREITKLLANQESLTVKDSHSLERPFQMPNLNGNGSNNKELRTFAFNAYNALAAHFIEREWNNWVIAPCFLEGDDTASSFELRIYVDEDIAKTVVE